MGHHSLRLVCIAFPLTPSLINSSIHIHLKAYFSNSVPNVTSQSVISVAETALNATYNNLPITLEYYVNANNAANLVYVFQVQNSTTGAWYEVFVDANTRQLVSVIDYVSKATVSNLCCTVLLVVHVGGS